VKAFFRKGLVAIIGLCVALAAIRACDGSVVAVMERAAAWQLDNPSPKWKSTEWHNAAFYAGVMALSEESTNPRFRDAMMRMGESSHWRLGVRVYHADDQAVGQTYADLFALTHDARMIGPMQERFDYVLAHPKNDDLVFDKVANPDFIDHWSWCDSLFMAPPAWAKLARVTGDSRYLDFAIGRWWVTSDYLYQKSDHLYFRDSTYFDRREKNGSRVYWARGNGWVLAGLVRMLEEMPRDNPARPRFLEQYRQMAERIAGLQDPDGFWHSSLLDPQEYPMKESSGTGFFCYALAWGINGGILDRAHYEPVVTRAWAALLTCIEPSGRLNHVQPVGSTPVTFDGNSTEPYGVGAFLLAGSEMARLAPLVQTALLTPPEKARLIELTRDDASAHAQASALISRADAALLHVPNPIREILTEGKLAGDPVKVATQESLKDMQDLWCLGFAYLLTGDAPYADKTRLIVLAWSRINHPTGDPIDETNLEPLIVAYDLTRATYPDADKAEADSYLRRLIKAEWGARQLATNWQSHRLKIVGLAAYVLRDEALVSKAIEGFKGQVDANLNADGSSYDFIERDALHYHVYDLEPLLALSIAAHRHGLDLYDYAGAKGGSLRKSVNFLVPYCSGEMQHHEFVNSKVRFDRERAKNGEKGYQTGHLFRAEEGLKALSLAAYFDDSFAPVLASLASRSDDPTIHWNLLIDEAARLN
jgi:unsaturated rhamnogalacturonyl hydrolase